MCEVQYMSHLVGIHFLVQKIQLYDIKCLLFSCSEGTIIAQ